MYETINEILLLFNQPRISIPFFVFFFLGRNPTNSSTLDSVSLDTLNAAVRRFRGFALLRYGNFRYAFRKLALENDSEQFLESLWPWYYTSEELKNNFKSRKGTPSLVSDIERIPRNKTWLLGYIASNSKRDDMARYYIINAKKKGLSKTQLRKQLEGKVEQETLNQINGRWSESSSQFRGNLGSLEKQTNNLQSEMEIYRRKGTQNTIKYLVSEYVDVYVATSMRQRWEFEDTNEIIRSLASHRALKGLHIRWFDPTQSYENVVLDKGLLEGLMLNRVRCTVYLAQETETLGKDSELAATLAQGKPVIAFIPQIRESNLRSFSKKLKARPLEYFHQRLLVLKAERFFDTSSSLVEASRRYGLLRKKKKANSVEVLKAESERIREKLSEYLAHKVFQVIGDEEKRFRLKNAGLIEDTATLLAACESVSADDRAHSISRLHPLAMQLNLSTGVANGVLIARTIDQCAALIRALLVNDLHIRIEELKERTKDKEELRATIAVEQITNSQFRVVTANPTLTNSFWSFYAGSMENEHFRLTHR
jgi:hypothetical protein